MKALFYNTSWLVSEKALRNILELILSILLVRYLQPELFGVYSYCLAVLSLFLVLSKLGVDPVLVKECVDQKDMTDQLMTSVFWLRVFGGLLAATLMLFFAFLFSEQQERLFLTVLVFSLLFSPFLIVEFYFQAFNKNKIPAICRVAQLALFFPLKVFLLVYKFDLIYFLLAVLMEGVFLSCSYVYVYWQECRTLFFNAPSVSIMKRFLKLSWPLFFAAISVIVYMKIDQVMIRHLLGEYETGIYSAAARISEAWYFIPVLVCASLFPSLIRSKEKGQDVYKRNLMSLFCLLSFVSIMAIVVCWIFSRYFIVTVFGDEYAASVDVLNLHILSGLFVCFGVASGYWLLNEGLQILSLYRTVAGAVVNVVLNLVLIPVMGIYGAALSTLVSYAVSGLFADLFYEETRDMFWMKLKSLIPSINFTRVFSG